MRRHFVFVFCYCYFHHNNFFFFNHQYEMNEIFAYAFQSSLEKKSMLHQPRDDRNKKTLTKVGVDDRSPSSKTLNRRDLFAQAIKMTSVVAVGITAVPIIPSTAETPLTNNINVANAIEFVPASPFFGGTYKDAVDILYAQRIAVDNIGNVISDGDIEEAGFKVMQLSAQTGTAGKIVLNTFQEKMSSSSSTLSSSKSGIDNNSNDNNSFILLQFLSCQKKFAVLLDLCDECGISLQKAMKGKLGSTAVAQVKTLSIVNDTRGAYDDFLKDVSTIENILIVK